MKEKLLLLFALIFLVVILIGLNAVSYVQKEKVPDSELSPNRSTYNLGATGTRAFYEFLSESGYTIKRWREPMAKLKHFDPNVVSTFVIIGKVRRAFTEKELTKLMDWVSSGGTLVVIDRDPPNDLVSSTSYYSIEVDGGEKAMAEFEKETMLTSVDPASEQQMIAETRVARVLQPSRITRDIIGIQPSKFASSVKFSRSKMPEEEDESEVGNEDIEEASDATNSIASESETNESQPPPEENPISNSNVKEKKVGIGDGGGTNENEESPETKAESIDASLVAPVAHIGNDEKTLVVDFPFDSGKVVFLTDPYVVTNGGIRLADNVQLASNIVGSSGGIIAFDEFHQGYSNNENQALAYFSGTPVVAIVFQLLILSGVILFSKSRRFARALPHKETDRLAKLEYVSAMAQLQRRTKAYDLAIENIYVDFRRRVSRLAGVDNHATSREDLATLISDRTEYVAKDLDELMFKCEDITHGEPTSKKEIVQLIGKLREIEKRLGLARHKRKKH